MSRTGSQHKFGSSKVATWVAQSRSNGIVVGFVCLHKCYTDADREIIQYIFIFIVQLSRTTNLLIIFRTATKRPTHIPNVKYKQTDKN